MSPLLPPQFDALARAAVQHFWRTRIASSGSTGQAGNRGAVIAGKNLDGFTDLLVAVAMHAGLPRDAILTQGRTDLTLPGYFRATKKYPPSRHNREM